MISARLVLPSPGGPGQQHVVRRPAAPLGALEHQRQLAGDLRLADEVGAASAAAAPTRRPAPRRRPAATPRRPDRGPPSTSAGQRPVERRTLMTGPAAAAPAAAGRRPRPTPVAAICSSATGRELGDGASRPPWRVQPRPIERRGQLVTPRRDRGDRRQTGRAGAVERGVGGGRRRAGRAAPGSAAPRPSCRCRAPA